MTPGDSKTNFPERSIIREEVMPHFLAYRFGENPLAVTQSSTPKLSLKNFLVAIDVPETAENERVYAYLMEQTSITVMGESSARLFGITHGDEVHISLVSDFDNHRYTIKTTVHVGDSIQPSDYISLGWETVDENFVIGPEEDSGLLHLLAHDVNSCEPLQ